MTDRPEITDIVAASTYARAEEIAAAVLTGGAAPGKHNGRLDRIITSRTLGFPPNADSIRSCLVADHLRC